MILRTLASGTALSIALVACSAEPQQADTPPAVQSQAASSFAQSVDVIFSDFSAPDVPGCAVGVIHNGEFVHATGYGAANLEHGVAIDADSVFRIASISKQFTALAIAILADRGEIDLDADVHTYLPELADYGEAVTVRQMIHHVSGMGDYNDSFEVADGKPFRFGNQDFWTIEEFFAEVAKQPLAGPVGEEFRYSNLAYFLLGQVVERVSGQTLREFADAEIFDPLGMESTFFNDNIEGIVPNRADGYVPLEEGGFEIFMTNLDWVGDGGVYTSLNDFIKWDQALASEKIPGGDSVYQLMITPHPVTVITRDDGALNYTQGYSFGLYVGSNDGRAFRSHSGGWVGFRTYYMSYPDDNLSVITFCNRADGAGDRLGNLLDLTRSEFMGSEIENE